MPRLSVIVPVFKVQGYLRECMDSVLSQSYRDLEVIAVDDCSPDGSGRILDEYAARDSRVTVLHLPENVGLGRARNAGVERASGDYILFLDSDDSYSDGALEAIVRQLEACGEPDVLVFDHVRHYWWNGVRESIFGELLASTGTRAESVFDNPELLRLFAVAWNKAYRREFYLAHELTFQPGLYEDAPLAYEVMISAETIACLSRPCVIYRQRPQGAITRSPGKKHFDIFPQYESLFAFLDERPHLDKMRPLLFERMISHYGFCIQRPDRVHPHDRRKYFRIAAEHFRRYRPDGFTPPKGKDGIPFRMMAARSYTGLALVESAKRVRRSLRKKARKLKHGLGRAVYKAYYAVQRKLPVDEKLAVYSAYWDRGVSCNPAAIQQKAAELAPDVKAVWVVRPSAVQDLPKGTDYILPRSPRYWRTMARAKFFVNNVNFPDFVEKRPGQLHVMTHHGTPLKSMGLDQQPFPAAGMSFRALLRRAARWNYSVSSNPHSTEVWDRVFPCPYEHVEAGYPRNDVYATASEEDVLDIRRKLGIAPDKIALLYAPTMRDYRKGFVPQLDLERVSRELGDDYVLLVRTHYFYGDNRSLTELQERGVILDVSRYPSVEELNLASDALITDYSSVMFDYAVLDRPIISYVPDWEAYRASRGVYFELVSGRRGETPGAVARSEDELIETFTSGAWDNARTTELRQAFRERFCPFDDGHAAERVVRRVLLGEDESALPAVVPVAERQPARPPRLAEPPPSSSKVPVQSVS